jgi:hypothetical protein
VRCSLDRRSGEGASLPPADPLLRGAVFLAYLGRMTLDPIIALLPREVGLPEWQVGATISTAAIMIVVTSQLWEAPLPVLGPKARARRRVHPGDHGNDAVRCRLLARNGRHGHRSHVVLSFSCCAASVSARPSRPCLPPRRPTSPTSPPMRRHASRAWPASVPGRASRWPPDPLPAVSCRCTA